MKRAVWISILSAIPTLALAISASYFVVEIIVSCTGGPGGGGGAGVGLLGLFTLFTLIPLLGVPAWLLVRHLLATPPVRFRAVSALGAAVLLLTLAPAVTFSVMESSSARPWSCLVGFTSAGGTPDSIVDLRDGHQFWRRVSDHIPREEDSSADAIRSACRESASEAVFVLLRDSQDAPAVPDGCSARFYYIVTR